MKGYAKGFTENVRLQILSKNGNINTVLEVRVSRGQGGWPLMAHRASLHRVSFICSYLEDNMHCL